MSTLRRAGRPSDQRNCVKLTLERLEDRLQPGDALLGLLIAPMGLAPLHEMLPETSSGRDVASTAQIGTSYSSAWLVAHSATSDSGPSTSLSADRRVENSAPAHNATATQDAVFSHSVGSVDLTSTGLLSIFAGNAQAQTRGASLPTHAGDGGSVGFAGAPSGPAVNYSSPTSGTFAPIQIGQADAEMAAAEMAGGYAQPLLKHGHTSQSPRPLITPAGYSPTQVRHAYGFDALSQNGLGVTIAIVDAFDDPNIQSDLDTFSTQYGLPTTGSGQFTFSKVYAQGHKPRGDTGWAEEMSLDVEWAHAIAPRANIMLVESATNSFSNLLGGVDYAVSHGAHIVSMSWGGGDSSGEASNDTHFNKPGVAFFASSGDTGAQVIYPSASPYVVSVGGTNLPLDGSGNLTGSETAWSGGGGGVSVGEARPTYQTNYGLTYSGRATPDVSYNADPNTGVAVYDSYHVGGWLVFGGTSAGAPQWAALTALVDQSRATPLQSSDLTNRFDYNAATGAAYSSNYRDITGGSNGFPAGTGYDLATGVGSPLANNLVPYLVTH